MSAYEGVPDHEIDDIKQHLGFLFERGYQIVSTKEINKSYGVWEVLLKHFDFYVRINGERGGVDLEFGSPSKGYTSVHLLIYFITDGKQFSTARGLKKDAKLLQQYIEEFELCYGVDFQKNQDGLKAAEKLYSAQVRESIDTLVASKGYGESNKLRDRVRFFIIFLPYFLFGVFVLPMFGLNLDDTMIFVASVVLAFLTDFLIGRRK